MAMRDEDIGAALTLAEGTTGSGRPHGGVGVRAARLAASVRTGAFARGAGTVAGGRGGGTRGRAAPGGGGFPFPGGFPEVAARQEPEQAGGAVEQTREVRRAAKDALFFQAEVARLEKLLSEAGVESSRRSTIISLRMEVVRLREALQASQARKDTTAAASAENVKPPKAAPVPKAGKDTAGALSSGERPAAQGAGAVPGPTDTIEPLRAELRGSRKETVRLNKEIARLGEEASAAYRDTNKSLRADNVATHKAVRASERQCKWLDTDNADLRWALRASHDHKERLEARHRDEIDWLNKEIARQHSFYVRASREREAMLAPLHKRIGQLRGGNRAGQGHDRVAAREERPSACRGAGVEGREDGAGLPRRDSGSPACQAPLDPDRLVEGAVREQERAAEEIGHGAQARPAARRARPRPHPAARARGEDRTPQPARRMRACVPVAGSSMWRTASVPRPSSRSRSRPTPARSSARAGAGVATARPRPWR